MCFHSQSQTKGQEQKERGNGKERPSTVYHFISQISATARAWIDCGRSLEFHWVPHVSDRDPSTQITICCLPGWLTRSWINLKVPELPPVLECGIWVSKRHFNSLCNDMYPQVNLFLKLRGRRYDMNEVITMKGHGF